MGSAALVVIVPGDLRTLTGGYAYDRRIVAGLRDRGWTVEVRGIVGSFPTPAPAALARAARVLSEIADGATVLVDGLAFGAMPAAVEREAGRLRFVALVHHPLAAETGISASLAATLEAGERRALACARKVIVTSRATAAMLAAYDVPADRIVVVEPGTDRPVERVLSDPPVDRDQVGRVLSDPADRSGGSKRTRPTYPKDPPNFRLLCVATLSPRKGHDVLFRALAMLRDLPWRLTCVGGLDRDPATAARLRAQVRADGLEGRVTFAGEMSGAALDAEYARADLFVLPTLYEGYGMVVAEALAHGVPVISTPTGGIEELVGRDAGLLVPPGDADALASALTRVLTDANLRAQLTHGAQLARDRIPTWDQQVEKMAAALSVDTADAGRVVRTRHDAIFSADWLALREPADTAARSAALTRAIADGLPRARPLRILDLGAGTGANARYLIARLPTSEQDWLLVDHDPSLLARASVRVPSAKTHAADLRVLGDVFAGRHLVTASALLDLVSESWLRALAEQCAANRSAVLFSLTYDGRIECSPAERDDEFVRDLVNRHQRTDKGFGPALGPDAAGAAGRCFTERGYEVRRERSDWELTPESRDLQEQLIDGWARAAVAIEPARADVIADWRARRLAHVAAGRSRMIVGHEDLAAWLAGGSERTRPTDLRE
ncbi:MAG: glycosyltransferase [Acidobacteria bacterium]|nr:glycosyltransferase [Acidobacteriota bacterium]